MLHIVFFVIQFPVSCVIFEKQSTFKFPYLLLVTSDETTFLGILLGYIDPIVIFL